MKNWLKLAIPVLLGLIAAGVHYASMTQTVKYVAVSREIAEGEPISRDALTHVAIAHNSSGLETAAIKWRDRAVLFDRPATRLLNPGDLVFKRDFGTISLPLQLGRDEVAVAIQLNKFDFDPRLLKIGNEVGFFVLRVDEEKIAELEQRLPQADGSSGFSRYSPYDLPVTDPRVPSVRELLGPFRIVAVGAHTHEDLRVLESDESGEAPTSISLAVKYDERSQLIDKLGGDVIVAKNQNANEAGGIKAMVLFREAHAAAQNVAEPAPSR